jgi:hypothetical protein
VKSDLREYAIEEVFNGYKDSQEEGVVALGGKLNIRPAYQREFVYKDKQRNAVIETIVDRLPLNLMYWARTGVNTYEVLDGQQRTLSACQYVNGDFSLNNRYFHNLTNEEQRQILDYRLLVCICQGSPKELLSWFEKVNIAGEKLTAQELRNAVYTGPWLSDAKLKFSKTNCPAYLLANSKGSLLHGTPIRQDYLETALEWISAGNIEGYMAEHQHHEAADELWHYFQDVVAWVQKTFPVYRAPMQRVPWGHLYNDFSQGKFDANMLESDVSRLMMNDDVQKKVGIYEYLLTGDEKFLNLRAFSEAQKVSAYERQGGLCSRCENKFNMEEMEADHITPWHEGGKTMPENCQMLCKHDNRTKSGK